MPHNWFRANSFERMKPVSTEPTVGSDRRRPVELLEDPDAALVAACRQPGSDGFERAFEELFTRYRDRVYAIAFRVLGNAVDALDVVQESFALVFRKLASFRGGSLFSTWLFRIVVNSSIDHRRKHSNRPMVGIDNGEDVDQPDREPGPVDRAETSELAGQVQSALDFLSPKLRAILALRYLEDMSYEELACALSLSLGTVKCRLARAHLALEQVVRTKFPQLDLGAGPDVVGGVG